MQHGKGLNRKIFLNISLNWKELVLKVNLKHFQVVIKNDSSLLL